MKSQFLLPLFFLFGLLLIGLTILTLQDRQKLSTYASAESILYFTPESSFLKPLKRRVDDRVSLDIMVNPGNNKLSIIKLAIEYDADVFRPLDKDTLILSPALPSVIEGPVINDVNGTITIIVAVGIEPNKAISSTTKIATLNLMAIKDTKGSTKIAFGPSTQAYSVASTDHAYANVIATAIPAYLTLIPNPNVKIPGASPAPREVLTSPTATPPLLSLTPTPNLNATILDLEVFLNGIGSRTSSDAAKLHNKNPRNPIREFTLTLENTFNKTIATRNVNLVYDTTSGLFKGTANLGSDFPTGQYIVRIKDDNFLEQRFPGAHHIATATKSKMATVSLTAGDANNDNRLDVVDYNTMVECFYEIASICTDKNRASIDFNDDGSVDQTDYNLLTREMGLR